MTVPAKLILYRLNDQVVELDGLQDLLSADYLNAATLTASLYDQFANPIFEDIDFSYLANSDGVYRAVIPGSGFNPGLGAGYKLIVDGNQSGSDAIHLVIQVEIQDRSQ